MESVKMIANKYELGTKLGNGAFGEVFLGTDIDTKKEVAVKLEQAKAKHPQVVHEAKLYKLLEDNLGIPKVHWVG